MEVLQFNYASIFLLGLILLLFSLGLLFPMGRYAKRQAESPRFWISLTVLAWGFIWVGKGIVSRLVYAFFHLQLDKPILQLIAILLCLVAYGIMWILLRRKTGKLLEKRIEEIGENKDS